MRSVGRSPARCGDDPQPSRAVRSFVAKHRIEIYERTDLQKWTLHDVIGEDSQVFLAAIGVSFELRELYTDLPDA